MENSWWRHGFLTRARRTSKLFLGSQILCIICVTKWYIKNGPNIWAHCGQQWAQNYKSPLKDARQGGITQNTPYLVMGKIPKMDVPDLRKTNQMIPHPKQCPLAILRDKYPAMHNGPLLQVPYGPIVKYWTLLSSLWEYLCCAGWDISWDTQA